MAKLNECTHMYNGLPVKIMTDYVYTMAPGFVEIWEPTMGNRQIVAMKDLTPITKSTKFSKQENGYQKEVGNEQETGGEKSEKKVVKKVEPKKDEKKSEKKEDKKEEKKAKEKKDKKEKEAKEKKEKEAKEKKDEKKKKLKEDVASRIDDYIEEGWFSDKAKQIKFELNRAYEGILEFIDTFKSATYGIIQKGSRFFAKKEAGNPTVTLIARKDSALTNKDNIKKFHMDQINKFITLLGMKGIQSVYGRPAYGESVENKIDTFLEEKRTKGFLAGGIKKGAFHRWLGKAEDEPITMEDIKKGLASDDPHVVRMANFAKNVRKWKH